MLRKKVTAYNYDDALEYLKIADKAFNVGAYTEAAEIIQNIAYYAAGDNKLPPDKRTDLIERVKKAIGRFTFCPDECEWENICGLMDLFP